MSGLGVAGIVATPADASASTPAPATKAAAAPAAPTEAAEAVDYSVSDDFHIKCAAAFAVSACRATTNTHNRHYHHRTTAATHPFTILASILDNRGRAPGLRRFLAPMRFR